jgi:tyrosine-protein phosphatase YwqE
MEVFFMIDLHTHILYGIDDGAKTFDESFSMLKKLMNLVLKQYV